ncbi:43295_t:CDS:10, partial [Gigaspora margarita]
MNELIKAECNEQLVRLNSNSSDGDFALLRLKQEIILANIDKKFCKKTWANFLVTLETMDTTWFTAAKHRVEKQEYKKNFYVDGKKLFCEFCQHVVNHTRKLTLDSHLELDKYKNNVTKAERSENLNLTCQTTLDTTNVNINNREFINLDLVNAFMKANIPLHKDDKFKSFFLDAIANSNQLHNKYLSKVFDTKVLKLKNLLEDKRISFTIDKTTNACNRAVVHILFSFNNQTKLAKTEFITTVDSRSIAQSNINQLCLFYLEEEQVNNKNQAIQELASIFNNYMNTFIFEILTILVEDLEFFETRKKPVAPFVAQCLTHLEASLQSGIIEPPISEEIKSKFEDNFCPLESRLESLYIVNQLESDFLCNYRLDSSLEKKLNFHILYNIRNSLSSLVFYTDGSLLSDSIGTKMGTSWVQNDHNYNTIYGSDHNNHDTIHDSDHSTIHDSDHGTIHDSDHGTIHDSDHDTIHNHDTAKEDSLNSDCNLPNDGPNSHTKKIRTINS